MYLFRILFHTKYTFIIPLYNYIFKTFFKLYVHSYAYILFRINKNKFATYFFTRLFVVLLLAITRKVWRKKSIFPIKKYNSKQKLLRLFVVSLWQCVLSAKQIQARWACYLTKNQRSWTPTANSGTMSAPLRKPWKTSSPQQNGPT